jgi:hypothetical protein
MYEYSSQVIVCMVQRRVKVEQFSVHLRFANGLITCPAVQIAWLLSWMLACQLFMQMYSITLCTFPHIFQHLRWKGTWLDQFLFIASWWLDRWNPRLVSWISRIMRFRKIAKNDYYLRHVCPSVCPYRATLFPLDGFSRNLTSEYFSKICPQEY